MRVKKFNSEENLQIQVADYLRLQYPNVIFHSDYGSGINLTIGQAVIQKRLNGGKRAWPDMFISKPKEIDWMKIGDNFIPTKWLHGLYIELKKDGTKLKREKDCKKILKGDTKIRKAGDWWDKHIEEQAETLEQLRKEGYKADKWTELNLPLRHLSSYIKGANEEDSDEMIKFIPSGKYAKTKDGNRLEVWIPKAKQLQLGEIERSK